MSRRSKSRADAEIRALKSAQAYTEIAAQQGEDNDMSEHENAQTLENAGTDFEIENDDPELANVLGEGIGTADDDASDDDDTNESSEDDASDEDEDAGEDDEDEISEEIRYAYSVQTSHRAEAFERSNLMNNYTHLAVYKTADGEVHDWPGMSEKQAREKATRAMGKNGTLLEVFVIPGRETAVSKSSEGSTRKSSTPRAQREHALYRRAVRRESGAIVASYDTRAKDSPYSSDEGWWLVICETHNEQIRADSTATRRGYQFRPSTFCTGCAEVVKNGGPGKRTTLRSAAGSGSGRLTLAAALARIAELEQHVAAITAPVTPEGLTAEELSESPAVSSETDEAGESDERSAEQPEAAPVVETAPTEAPAEGKSRRSKSKRSKSAVAA
jgi:hypothetical protein